jgi:toxin ParE1/3/4
MLRLILTDEAKQDLLGIRKYTQAKWGILQTKIYLGELRNALKRLQEQPLIGTDHSADLGAGIYGLHYVSHMIYYKLQESDLLVLAILHQSMVPSLHLRQSH